MSDILKALKLINKIGYEDSEKIRSGLEVMQNMAKVIEGFSETEHALMHIMITANTCFNLLLKHRSAYIKYTNMTEREIDDILKSLHQTELAFEAELDQQ